MFGNKKSILLVFVLVGLSNQFADAFSLSPRVLIDNLTAKHYGSEPATELYQQKTHEFLGYLGIENACQVPVRQIKLSPDVMQYAAQTFIDRIPGFAASTGIWFNEAMFEKAKEETRLWYIAHEAGHYSLRHGVITAVVSTVGRFTPPFVMTGFIGASLLGFRWLSHKVAHLELHYDVYQKIVFVLATLYFGCGAVNGAQKGILVLYEMQKSFEKDADLAAANMLCSHGLAKVVELHIQQLKDAVAKGLIMLNGFNHPSFQEQFSYMQSFWDTWIAQHPEYETVIEVPQESIIEKPLPA